MEPSKNKIFFRSLFFSRYISFIKIFVLKIDETTNEGSKQESICKLERKICHRYTLFLLQVVALRVC